MAVDEQFENAITLVQYTQGLPDGSMERAVAETFIRESDAMAAIPIVPAKNGKYTYFQEEELPTVQNRAYNEPGHESTGRTSKQEEGIFLIDEYIKVDRAIVDNYGSQKRSEQESMKVKALSRHFSRLLINGDNTTEPREPNGLKKRSGMTEQTTIQNSGASGGAGLSLAKLDTLLMEVKNANALIVPRKLRPLLSAAARNPTITNNALNITGTDPFGRKVLAFDGIPILFGYDKSREDDLLDFNEVASGGGSAVTSSIYAVHFGQDGLFAIEGTPLSVQDEGLLPGVPLYSTHIKWDWGFVSKEFSIARLASIAEAAVTA